MNEAIKLAVEKGGYIDKPWSEMNGQPKQEIVLDPLFWHALGKALKWPEETAMCPLCESVTIGGNYAASKAHEYFELKLSGGDTEKFWKELLEQH